jgi:hypothetical protein
MLLQLLLLLLLRRDINPESVTSVLKQLRTARFRLISTVMLKQRDKVEPKHAKTHHFWHKRDLFYLVMNNISDVLVQPGMVSPSGDLPTSTIPNTPPPPPTQVNVSFSAQIWLRNYLKINGFSPHGILRYPALMHFILFYHLYSKSSWRIVDEYVFRAGKLSCYIPSWSEYPDVIEFSHILRVIDLFISGLVLTLSFYDYTGLSTSKQSKQPAIADLLISRYLNVRVNCSCYSHEY